MDSFSHLGTAFCLPCLVFSCFLFLFLTFVCFIFFNVFFFGGGGWILFVGFERYIVATGLQG